MILKFEKDIALENDRVQLRPLVYKDAPELEKIAFSPEIWEYMTLAVRDRESLTQYITDALTSRMGRQTYPFVIVDKRSGKIAGCTRFCNYAEFDLRIEIGYTWHGLAYQRTGINRNAKFLLLQYAFEELGLLRVEFKTDSRNTQSRNALLRMGATEEGILRSHSFLHNGYRRDTVYFSILKEEWGNLLLHQLV